MTDDESIIQELRDEHGIMAVVLRCPCSCDGKIQYGIDEVELI